MPEISGYIGLFLAAFLAATIIPAQSEAVLAGMVISGAFSTPMLLLVASIGNILGSLVNWILGRGIERFRQKRWFPASEAQMLRARAFYGRWGYWSLLLSWVPVIGDPITLIAGVMREPLWRFLLLVSIAKAGRYIVLIMVLKGVM